MEIYTIGFGQKTAAEFFGKLRSAGIRRLVDIRLNNVSQLAGFTKRDDLPFFLKELCGADYLHATLLAPTQEILDAYKKNKKNKGSWEDYERTFLELIKHRQIERTADRASFNQPSVLLCSEPTPDHCHRRLVAEYLSEKWGDCRIIHL